MSFENSPDFRLLLLLTRKKSSNLWSNMLSNCYCSSRTKTSARTLLVLWHAGNSHCIIVVTIPPVLCSNTSKRNLYGGVFVNYPPPRYGVVLLPPTLLPLRALPCEPATWHNKKKGTLKVKCSMTPWLQYISIIFNVLWWNMESSNHNMPTVCFPNI